MDLPQSSMTLRLFTTQGCHLCEQALSLVEPWRAQGVTVELVEITDHADWVEQYGVRIPVLQNAQGDELGWPFDAPVLADWLSQNG